MPAPSLRKEDTEEQQGGAQLEHGEVEAAAVDWTEEQGKREEGRGDPSVSMDSEVEGRADSRFASQLSGHVLH